MARTGVFVCHCGCNIAGVVKVGKVVAVCQKIPGVVYTAEHEYYCSEPGQEEIKKAIVEHRLNQL